jgi:ABC-2 type transport system permease protein
MKTIPFFIKTLTENCRDWMILVMTVAFAPMFIYLMYAYMNGSGASTFTVAVANLDTKGAFSHELIGKWRGIVNTEGKAVMDVRLVNDTKAGRKMIKNRTAELLMTIPSDFSTTFSNYCVHRKGSISGLESYGDPANIKYIMAASLCDYATFGYVSEKAGIEIPLNIKFEAAGAGRSQRDFDLFFPSLLGVAIIMIIFTAAGTLVREVEKGTMTRLVISRLSSFEMLGAVALGQLIIGIASFFLTYCAGLSVGYRSNGSLWLLLLIAAVTCLSVIAMSIITACFVRTLFGLLTIGTFPWFILTFFSDCFMPLPKYHILTIFGNPVYLNDVLPTAIATRAYAKILNYNAHFTDISFEFFAILVLSLSYFFIGALLFKKKHMSVS